MESACERFVIGIVNGDCGVSWIGTGTVIFEKFRNEPFPVSTGVYSWPGKPPTSASIHDRLLPGSRWLICKPPRIVVLSWPPNFGDHEKPRAGDKLFLSLSQMPYFGYCVPFPIRAICVKSPF